MKFTQDVAAIARAQASMLLPVYPLPGAAATMGQVSCSRAVQVARSANTSSKPRGSQDCCILHRLAARSAHAVSSGTEAPPPLQPAPIETASASKLAFPTRSIMRPPDGRIGQGSAP